MDNTIADRLKEARNKAAMYPVSNAIRLNVKRGKYGGMYAHKNIAFEFASVISPVFKIYLIREFQRLKEQENDQNKTEWNSGMKRMALNSGMHVS